MRETGKREDFCNASLRIVCLLLQRGFFSQWMPCVQPKTPHSSIDLFWIDHKTHFATCGLQLQTAAPTRSTIVFVSSSFFPNTSKTVTKGLHTDLSHTDPGISPDPETRSRFPKCQATVHRTPRRNNRSKNAASSQINLSRLKFPPT